MTPSRDIGRLLDIMAALRRPQSGCPWDLAQSFATIAPYTLEEAYEVADAIARDDLADLKDELVRQTNQKFESRFSAIERALAARGKAPQDATLAEMDALWDEAKE